MVSSIDTLRPFGRFIELGKRDFYENSHIGLRPFRNNISYFGVDADQLMGARPDLTARLWCDAADYWDIKFEMTKAVKEAFDREGITIPFPQRDVHFYGSPPAASGGQPPAN